MKSMFGAIKNLFGAKTEDSVVATGPVDAVLGLFVAPLDGAVLPIANVPDKVFSEKIMGDGFAIEPINGHVVSPVNGVISTLTDTKHAVAITADNGLEMIIHFGMDTVNLKGEGFAALVKTGDKVKVGQPLLKVDFTSVKAKVPSIITPIVFTNLPTGKTVNIQDGQNVKRGESGFITIK